MEVGGGGVKTVFGNSLVTKFATGSTSVLLPNGTPLPHCFFLVRAAEVATVLGVWAGSRSGSEPTLSGKHQIPNEIPVVLLGYHL